MTNSAPVEKLFTSTRPGRALANRFVAGDTLDGAVAVAKELNRGGFEVSLDLLGEEVRDQDSALAATDEYLACLDAIESEALNANISIKPTQLGLAIDEGFAVEAIGKLGARAAEVGTTVTIDMEDSRYTEATVRLYEKAQGETGNFGIALQAYMHRTPDDLTRLIPLGGHIRLCKGAYVEDDDVALTSKAEVDRAYGRQLQILMSAEQTRPAIATHDPVLLDLARRLAKGRSSEFEYQMLFGVRLDLQREIVAAGDRLRIYLPFGSQWYPYLTRRLAERPSNVWFFLKALFGAR